MQSFELTWDDAEQSIFHFNCIQKWSWDEFHEAVTQAFEMIKSVKHPVDVIATMAGNFPLPSSSAMTHFNYVANNQPANVRLVVVVTENRFIYTINDIFFKVNKKARETGAIALSREEAYKIIAQRRVEAAVHS